MPNSSFIVFLLSIKDSLLFKLQNGESGIISIQKREVKPEMNERKQSLAYIKIETLRIYLMYI